MRPITMIVVAALALLLVNVPLSQSCDGEGQVLICQNTPFDFRVHPGFLTLVILLQDIGEINATVFRSSNLASVTRLRIDSAGVTGIAEGAFGSLQNLTSVSLRRNELTQMNSNWFGHPALLREISLEENQIEVLSESMLTGLTGLTMLSLRMNRIRTIESNSFLSQTNLSELDLSGNRLTRVSPQVFRTLSSTRIRLDGNPWDCSCAAEEFVLSIQDLHNRSLLDQPMDVTCETPPTLRGRPVWNVSVCVTSPSSEPDLRPSDTPPTVPATSEVVTALTQQTTSVQNRSTVSPTTVSAHTAATDPTQPTTETSAGPLSTDERTTQTRVTAPPSETESLTPSPTGVTETCVTSNSDTNTVCTLIIVIVILCVLLFVVCFLVLRHRRRRNNKTVMPGRPEEEKEEEEEVKEVENDSRSNLDPSPEESRDLEGTGWRPFTGVRAKSAGAVLFMSPSCASVKDQVALQHETEAQSSVREAADGGQKVENEAGGIQTENLTNTPDTTQRRTDAGGSLDDNSHCVSVSTDTVAYLSIGGITSGSVNKPNPDNLSKQPTDSSRGQRSQMGKVIGRISTWPPTAVQWQARCKMIQEMEKEEEEGRKETEEKGTNKQPPSFCTHEDEKVENQMEDVTSSNKDPLKINAPGMKLKFCDVQAQSDTKKEEDRAKVAQTGSKNQTVNKEKRNQRQKGGKSVEKPAQNSRRTKRDETSRPDNTGSGSRARTSGASPDDETLLRGNEYAFMDLLHEVAQNNGRWTRERWKQVHVNKQRR